MSKDTKSSFTDPHTWTEIFPTALFDISLVCRKPIELSFTAEKISSDGRLPLLREVESKIGLLQAIPICIEEDRHPG